MSGMNGGEHITSSEDKPWEALNVTEQQYEKYFDKETGTYNWQNHAVELQHSLDQKSKKDDNESADSVSSANADDAAMSAVEKAGLNFGELANQIMDKGDISPEARTALQKIGIDDDVIDGYIKGLENSAIVQFQEINEALGGAEGIASIRGIMDEQGWDENRRGDIENRLANPKEYKKAIEELVALKGDSTAPQSRPQPSATPRSAPTTVGYANQEEMNAAMQDPRYRDRGAEGQKYRAEVMARARASTWEVNPRAQNVGW